MNLRNQWIEESNNAYKNGGAEEFITYFRRLAVEAETNDIPMVGNVLNHVQQCDIIDDRNQLKIIRETIARECQKKQVDLQMLTARYESELLMVEQTYQATLSLNTEVSPTLSEFRNAADECVHLHSKLKKLQSVKKDLSHALKLFEEWKS